MSIGPEYIAGFFDGEGCISARVNNRGQVIVTISIVQKGAHVLREIKDYFEYGCLRRMSGESRKTHNLWSYQVLGSEQKLDFLRIIYPHLIVKREQTELAIKLMTRFVDMGNPRSAKIPKDEKEVRVELAKRITELKTIKEEL